MVRNVWALKARKRGNVLRETEGQQRAGVVTGERRDDAVLLEAVPVDKVLADLAHPGCAWIELDRAELGTKRVGRARGGDGEELGRPGSVGDPASADTPGEVVSEASQMQEKMKPRERTSRGSFRRRLPFKDMDR